MLDTLRAALRVIEYLEGRPVASAAAVPNPDQPSVWAIRATFSDASTGDYVFRMSGVHPFTVTPAAFPRWPPPGANPISLRDP